MRHPPYHLRANKAIDRFLLVELISLLGKHVELSNYTYFGFGGPFLEDCRLIHDRCPDIKIVSIEKNTETFKRQQFHQFSKNLELRHEDLTSFIANFSGTGGEVFWLDYTNLRYAHFDEFMSILERVSEKSIVKITIPAEHKDLDWDGFQRDYHQVLPASCNETSISRPLPFMKILLEMLQIASQQALSATGEYVFQILDSSHYNDQSQMLSVTGIVRNKSQTSEIREWFKNRRFLNPSWESSRRIDVPVLSVKERMLLEKHLPTKTKTGRYISRVLGYRIDDTSEANIEKLKQYEGFYQYYPYFARITI